MGVLCDAPWVDRCPVGGDFIRDERSHGGPVQVGGAMVLLGPGDEPAVRRVRQLQAPDFGTLSGR
jgi:hypothetical protein